MLLGVSLQAAADAEQQKKVSLDEVAWAPFQAVMQPQGSLLLGQDRGWQPKPLPKTTCASFQSQAKPNKVRDTPV